MTRITRQYVGQGAIPGNQWYPHLEDGRIVLGFGEHKTAKGNPVLFSTEDDAVAALRSRTAGTKAWVRMTADGLGSGNLISVDNLLIDGVPA